MLRKSKHRVEPLEAPYADDTAAALQLLGPPIVLFRVLARRPQRALGIAGWGHYYLSRDVALSLRQRELVIDRTTALCGADYEWAVHVAYFRQKAALSEAQLLSLASGSHRDPCWTDVADSAVLQAVDDLHRTHDLGDTSWADLVRAVGEEGAIDVMLLCGWYHAISFVVRGLRLPLEPGTTALIDAASTAFPASEPPPTRASPRLPAHFSGAGSDQIWSAVDIRIRRLRRAALKQGLRLRKIPERSSMYWQYGPHMLVDAHRDWMVGVEHERHR